MQLDSELDRSTTQERVSRAYLEVPFAEKEIVKALGAKWDPENFCWYVRAADDLTPFAQWRPIWPFDNDPVVKVLGLPTTCWKCISATLAVIACQYGDEVVFAHAAMLQVLASQLSPEELAGVCAGPLRPRFANTTGHSNWSNGCVECDALLGGQPLWESFAATVSQGQEDLPGITFAKVPVELLRAGADFN
jgi:hypothetical protein